MNNQIYVYGTFKREDITIIKSGTDLGITVANKLSKPIIKGYDLFNEQMFYTCLLMSLNGKTLRFGVGHSEQNEFLEFEFYPKPLVGISDLSLSSSIFMSNHYVGNLLVSCVKFFNNLLTGKYDKTTMDKLITIGFPIHLLTITTDTNADPFTKNIHLKKSFRLEPSMAHISVINGTFLPIISYLFNSGNEIISKWITKNFYKMTDVFPIIKELDKLYVCYTIVLLLRSKNVNMSYFEDCAIKSYSNNLDYKLITDDLDYIFDTNQINYRLATFDRNTVCRLHIRYKSIQSSIPTEILSFGISPRTFFKIENGFEINIPSHLTVGHVYTHVCNHLHFIMIDWVHLYMINGSHISNKSNFMLEHENLIHLNKPSIPLELYGFKNGEEYELQLMINICQCTYISKISKHVQKIII